MQNASSRGRSEQGGGRLIGTLCERGVVPIIDTPSARLAGRAVEWLNDAGFRTFVLSGSINGVVDLVAELSSTTEFDVGVGAVTDAGRADACIEAGANYVVSPILAAQIVAPCRGAGVACLLGAATPSEVAQAAGLGADGVMIFPAGCLGGVPYLKTLKAAFPDTLLVPAGRVEIGDVAPYLKAGAGFVGVGSRLVDAKALCSGDKDAIIDAAANALEQAQSVREPQRSVSERRRRLRIRREAESGG